MNIIIHADDYGISDQINNNIIDTFIYGCLNSLSIVPNGCAFYSGMKMINKYDDLKLSIHLNICEGKPLSNIDEVPNLVNSKGIFYKSFLRLWVESIISKNLKKKLSEEIFIEINRQIEKVKNNNSKKKIISIDSHKHFHMIPFVFDIFSKLAVLHDIKRIRLINEPFFLTREIKNNVINILSFNIIKQLLLKLLTIIYKKRLNNIGIEYNKYFVGVLFSGYMNLSVVKSAIKILRQKKADEVEILFHPGGAIHKEISIWKDNINDSKYYLSKNRMIEKNELLSKKMNNYLYNNLK